MLTLDQDRRRHARIALQRPCKIFDPRSAKYYPGTTRDLSEGSMMIVLAANLDIQPGDVLHVGVAQTRRQMLLRTADMMRMRVVRSLGTPNNERVIALELLDPIPAEAVLLRLAA